jgi:hypothetical protein
VRSKKAALIVAASVAVGMGTGGAALGIVGGTPTQRAPSWIGSLQLASGGHECGASLVSATWAVTAKHCTEVDLAQARFGSLDYGSGGELVEISDAVTDPNGSDVALIQLSTAVTGTPVTIASSSPEPGTGITLLGWGQTAPEPGGSGPSSSLKQLSTEVVDDSKCSGGEIDDNTELCIGSTTDQTACYGDSGGPAVVEGMLVGATSRSSGSSTCGESDTVYEDLTALRDWITQTIGSGSEDPPGQTPPSEDPPSEDPPGQTPPGEDPWGQGFPGEDPWGQTPPGEDPWGQFP